MEEVGLGLNEVRRRKVYLEPPWSEEKMLRSDRALVEKERLGPFWSEEKGTMSDRTYS